MAIKFLSVAAHSSYDKLPRVPQFIPKGGNAARDLFDKGTTIYIVKHDSVLDADSRTNSYRQHFSYHNSNWWQNIMSAREYQMEWVATGDNERLHLVWERIIKHAMSQAQPWVKPSKALDYYLFVVPTVYKVPRLSPDGKLYWVFHQDADHTKNLVVRFKSPQ